MMKLFKMLFFNSMILGTFIALSAYSWLTAWIGLEINLLSIIPLLKNVKNKYPSESALKYFVTQVMASSILLYTMAYLMMTKNMPMENLNMVEAAILNSALLLKLGAAPFHFWLPEVLSGLNWNNAFIMLTWQKIAPMTLVSYNVHNNPVFFSFIIIISSMISGLQGLNQICMRKIMAYSSINHIGWMISSLLNSSIICVYYFVVYTIINLSIILVLKNYMIYYMNQLTSIFNFNKKVKFIFMMNFMSLGGLPPFLGFLPKWLAINNMVDNNHYFLAFMLIVFTLISLYFYLRITFSTFVIFSEESLLLTFNKINSYQLFTNLLSLMGLITCTMISSMS